jgi:hypothetical protein
MDLKHAPNHETYQFLGRQASPEAEGLDDFVDAGISIRFSGL